MSHSDLRKNEILFNLESEAIDDWFRANNLTTNSEKASNFIFVSLSHTRNTNFTMKI